MSPSVIMAALVATLFNACGLAAEEPASWIPRSWTTAASLEFPAPTPGRGIHLAYKDPSVVRAKDAWHLWVSRVRHEDGKTRYALAYMGLPTWEDAPRARVVTALEDAKLACAPAVFRYAPTGVWYLLYVWENAATGYAGPAFSTLEDIDRPETLSAPMPLYDRKPDELPKKRWLDFTVIGDATRMWLYFTDDHGAFLRASTSRADFPRGWGAPEVVLQMDKGMIFEGSQTYAVPGRGYRTIIEGIGPGGRRYYNAWSAQDLGGAWNLDGTSFERPFAGPKNVVSPWSVHVSHGELIRTGTDETMEISDQGLQFLYQGWDGITRVPGVPLGRFNGYHEIPWRLALLTAGTQ